MSFTPPLRDLALSLRAAGFEAVLGADLDWETAQQVLEAAGAFVRDELAPLNRVGDQQGARYENGEVIAAPGFAQAYRYFVDAGWNSLSAPPEHGGQGLPKTLELAVFEMAHAANMAFTLCPMLTQAAIEAVAAFGDERQKTVFLPKLVSGEWPGAMVLTEPQAGSDLAAVSTRAEPDGQGGYRLSGQKIFITWGDHDAAENIVHLVLARLPDAPPGVKGISLFLTSKFHVDEAGALGARNDFRAGSIEHKLGIHGSPTCVMLYEGAQAELVGRAGEGLAQMFVMMNAARLQVGVQGVAIAERAYQQALAFSVERRQGRAAWSQDYPAALFDHPDVRRTLALMKAKTEAARGVCLACGVAADLGHAGDEAARARQALLTPIAKAWSTDIGVEVASLGVQVHGGMGFIEETGAAQHYRDARIAPIYEGTNGIQAIDLIGRKVAGDQGAAAFALIEEMAMIAGDLAGHHALAGPGGRLADAVDALRAATDWVIAHRGPEALSSATVYLRLFGETAGGWALLKNAALAGEADAWAASKTALAGLYADQVLTGAAGLARAVAGGAGGLEGLTPEALGA